MGLSKVWRRFQGRGRAPEIPGVGPGTAPPPVRGQGPRPSSTFLPHRLLLDPPRTSIDVEVGGWTAWVGGVGAGMACPLFLNSVLSAASQGPDPDPDPDPRGCVWVKNVGKIDAPPGLPLRKRLLAWLQKNARRLRMHFGRLGRNRNSEETAPKKEKKKSPWFMIRKNKVAPGNKKGEEDGDLVTKPTKEHLDGLFTADSFLSAVISDTRQTDDPDHLEHDKLQAPTREHLDRLFTADSFQCAAISDEKDTALAFRCIETAQGNSASDVDNAHSHLDSLFTADSYKCARVSNARDTVDKTDHDASRCTKEVGDDEVETVQQKHLVQSIEDASTSCITVTHVEDTTELPGFTDNVDDNSSNEEVEQLLKEYLDKSTDDTNGDTRNTSYYNEKAQVVADDKVEKPTEELLEKSVKDPDYCTTASPAEDTTDVLGYDEHAVELLEEYLQKSIADKEIEQRPANCHAEGKNFAAGCTKNALGASPEDYDKRIRKGSPYNLMADIERGLANSHVDGITNASRCPENGVKASGEEERKELLEEYLDATENVPAKSHTEDIPNGSWCTEDIVGASVEDEPKELLQNLIVDTEQHPASSHDCTENAVNLIYTTGGSECKTDEQRKEYVDNPVADPDTWDAVLHAKDVDGEDSHVAPECDAKQERHEDISITGSSQNPDVWDERENEIPNQEQPDTLHSTDANSSAIPNAKKGVDTTKWTDFEYLEDVTSFKISYARAAVKKDHEENKTSHPPEREEFTVLQDDDGMDATTDKVSVPTAGPSNLPDAFEDACSRLNTVTNEERLCISTGMPGVREVDKPYIFYPYVSPNADRHQDASRMACCSHTLPPTTHHHQIESDSSSSAQGPATPLMEASSSVSWRYPAYAMQERFPPPPMGQYSSSDSAQVCFSRYSTSNQELFAANTRVLHQSMMTRPCSENVEATKSDPEACAPEERKVPAMFLPIGKGLREQQAARLVLQDYGGVPELTHAIYTSPAEESVMPRREPSPDTTDKDTTDSADDANMDTDSIAEQSTSKNDTKEDVPSEDAHSQQAEAAPEEQLSQETAAEEEEEEVYDPHLLDMDSPVESDDMESLAHISEDDEDAFPVFLSDVAPLRATINDIFKRHSVPLPAKPRVINGRSVTVMRDGYGDPHILGTGIYGTVFLGRYCGAYVALKLFKMDHAKIDNIVREASILTYCNKLEVTPHCYGLMPMDTTNTKYVPEALVMAFLGYGRRHQSVTLYDLVDHEQHRTDRDLPPAIKPAQWVMMMIGLIEHLQILHQNHLIVNDIKCDNIVVVRKQNQLSLRFIDLGNALYKRSCWMVYFRPDQTPEDMLKECPQVAPEIAYEFKVYPESDVWALGNVFRVLAEKTKWRFANTLRNMCRHRPRQMRATLPQLNAALEEELKNLRSAQKNK